MEVINSISTEHNHFHFYGQELFALVLTFYQLKEWENSSQTMEWAEILKECARQSNLLMPISKSFTFFLT